MTEQTDPGFVPFTRAELHRDPEGHRVRVAHFPNPLSSGETLVTLELHYQDGAHVHTIDPSEPCPYSIAVHHDPSYRTELNPADAESALRAAGWAVTGPWTKRRAMLRSDVTRIG